jgi:hypothetical protein
MGDEIDVDLREEPSLLEKSGFNDGQLYLPHIGDGDKGEMGKERLWKTRDLHVDDGVAGVFTEVGMGMGEAAILHGRYSKGG